MKRTNIFLAVIGLIGMTSCRQEALLPEVERAREPIQFQATAGAFQVKATDTAFEVGDVIGLSVSEPVDVSNAMLQLTDDGLVPQETIYWAKNQTVASSFDAYYPYQDGVDFVSGFTFTVNPDQSTHALYTESDFMSAHTESAPDDGVVELKFTHQLSKLVLVIDNKLDEDIADVYVGGVQGRAKVVAGSAPVAEGLPGTIKAGAVKLSGIGPAYALVMAPQETSPKLMVTTVSGKQYTFVLPEAVSFVSGMRYLTHIAISADSTFSDFSVEVSEWTDNAGIQFGRLHYLTFTSEGTTSISLGGSFGPILYYSRDSITWEEWDYSELTFGSDSPLYVCGDNPGGLNNAIRFQTQGDKFAVSGSVMSLLDRYSELTAIPGSSAYCFGHLFSGCTGLTSAPELPATTLADACYVEMFSGCTSLTSAPELPATTLANECYWGMFSGCTGLTAATELPATTLANRCYLEMFYGCIGLISAPELPATTLAEECYFDMFSGCTSLTSAPELPAATLVKSCYSGMFGNCSGLISAPKLPVTTLADDCYTCMFYGCSGLTSAPELPATTLANSCYTGMFAGCTSLTIAPELPATSLEDYCYASMFEDCTGLTAAPELPASTLADYCYMYMFSNCSNLNYVKCLATDISASFCTGGWLTNVSTSGTFVKASGMNDWPVGESGIPEGWTVEEN